MSMRVFSQIVEENGKTIKENNLEIKHAIPLGAVVEVDFDKTRSTIQGVDIGYTGKAKLFVVRHGRDCDGTPLYSMADQPIAPPEKDYSLSSPGWDYIHAYRWWCSLINFNLNAYSEENLLPTGHHAERFYESVEDFARMLRGE